MWNSQIWETALDRVLRRLVRQGHLRFTYPSGRLESYGTGGDPEISVELSDPAAVRRLVLVPDLALGEAYMDGSFVIDGDDLYGFLGLMMRNMGRRGVMLSHRPDQILRQMYRRLSQFNPMARARRNVAHHYDLSGELYDLFLDSDRQYSCGYFKSPNDTLEQAQAQKKAHIAAKLCLEPGMRVLDIGCGWGGLALTLAQDYGATVTGITLSAEQHEVAVRRAEERGLSHQVTFRLQDYRRVSETYDRVVSVGMFEHVGVPHYRRYFRSIHDRLAPDGVALLHTIGRSGKPGATSRWIDRYIFPGGYIPALSEATAAIEKENLTITDVEVWRLHYAETLKRWHDRFKANVDKAEALYDARFCRMWRFYLVAAELSFRLRDQLVFQIQLSHEPTAVPLTREYLYPVQEQMKEAAE